MWRPALYARMQVAFDGEVRLVHRLRFPADDASLEPFGDHTAKGAEAMPGTQGG